jgi:hypothetical protein
MNAFEDAAASDVVVVQDDPRSVWTVEEDLRLLEGLRHHGLGNWTEISESVSGQGSTGKTPRRCMERYFDDFLGRYGYILPPYMLTSEEEKRKAILNAHNAGKNPRSSKRQPYCWGLLGFQHASESSSSSSAHGRGTIDQCGHIPPPRSWCSDGQDVGRDQAYKSEPLYVKLSPRSSHTRRKLRKGRKQSQ